MLLAPPLGTNFSFYEISPSGKVRDSFAGSLALLGVDIWGYSPPTTLIAAGACENGSVDCSIMADWTVDFVIDGLEYIRDAIKAQNHGAKIAVGGHSLGAITGLAAVG